MGNNISIGDVRVEKLVITSPRGSLTLTTSFVSASIYESIFTPGIVCDITVLDSQDIVGNLRILGDELVEFNMISPSDVKVNYKFALYERGEGQQLPNQRAKTYVLKCVSNEAMIQNNTIQKGYENVLNSEMVEDIVKTYMRSDKQIITERTRSPQRLLIANLNPFKAINLIKSRSISVENQSSSYVFFETRDGDKQIYKFVTIENLFATNIVKSFIQSSAININALSPDQDRNILSYQAPVALSALDRINYGGPTRVTTFNFTTQEYKIRDDHASDTIFKDGSNNTTGTDISSTFRNRYLTPKIPPQSFIPVDNSQRPVTYIAEGTPNLQAYIALLLQNSLRIRVPGDFILAPGVTINCTFPNNSATTGNVTEDPLLSGKFLISRIHHKIGLVQEKPRYTCIVECLKGRYREG
jgi:hypothetical protein